MAVIIEKEWIAGTPPLWVRHSAGAKQCPGCHHPLVERIVAEVLAEMGLEGKAIGVSGIGCSGRMFMVIPIDTVAAAHGRPPDVATGIKRSLDGKPFVFTIQGDGDAIAIGAGALINAAGRAEKITVLMNNNATYGTTGGQMAPTTLMGQVTTTSPAGRGPEMGYPIHVAELLVTIKGVCYSARGAVNTPANYQHTKKYIRTAFQKQMDGVGFSFVETLTACPPDWHMTPMQSLEFIEKKMIPEFPLGVFKNVDKID